MAKQLRILALGPREEISGLRTVGIECIGVETPAELEASLKGCVERPEVRIVLVSETVAEGAQPLADELRRKSGTVLLLIPSYRGAQGRALDWLREKMELTIGVDLVSQG